MYSQILFIENNSDGYILKLEEKYSIKLKKYHEYFPHLYLLETKEQININEEKVLNIDLNFLIPLCQYVNDIKINSASEGGNWGLLRLAEKDKWKETNWLPLEGKYISTFTSYNSNIFLFDSGIDTNNLEFKRSKIELVYDFENKEGLDINGHGSSVCSIITGLKYGVVKKSNIFNVKLTNTGNILFKDLLDAVISAIDVKNNKKLLNVIANIGFDSNHIIVDYVLYILSLNDFIVIAPAGNNNIRIDKKFKNNKLIFVGASGMDDKPTNFTNIGKDIKIYAPGINLGTLSIRRRIKTKVVSGTSFSAAFVTGCLILFLEENIFNLETFLEKYTINKSIPILICDNFIIKKNKDYDTRLDIEKEKRRFAIDIDLKSFNIINNEEEMNLYNDLKQIKELILYSETQEELIKYFTFYNKTKNKLLGMKK